MLLANLVTISIVLTWIPGFPEFHIGHIPELWIIVFVAVFYAPHYAYFTYKSRGRRIIDEHVERLGRSPVYGRVYVGASGAMFLFALLFGSFVIR